MKRFLTMLTLCAVIILAAAGICFIQHKKSEARANNKVAHIIFTSDQTYKEYLKVALQSAILNKKPESIYDIHILCVDLDEKDMEEYRKMSTKNVTINTIPEQVSNITIGQFPIANTRVSRADLFKFFMPQIMNEYDKILYIDSDTLILGDLLELYNTNLNGTCLGAVLKYTAVYNWKVYFKFYWKQVIEYEYNCGVMLFNLKEMRKQNITEQLIEAKNKDQDRKLMTQDAFNQVLPVKKIKRLSPVYNSISRWKPNYFKVYKFKQTYHPYLNDIDTIEELFAQTVIAHFAGYVKPWEYKDIPFAKEWVECAKKTPNYRGPMPQKTISEASVQN